MTCYILPVGNQNDSRMKERKDVRQGTLAWMVLKTPDVLGQPIIGRFLGANAEDLR